MAQNDEKLITPSSNHIHGGFYSNTNVTRISSNNDEFSKLVLEINLLQDQLNQKQARLNTLILQRSFSNVFFFFSSFFLIFFLFFLF